MITTKDIGKNNKQRSEEYEKNMDPDPKSRLAMEEFSGATTISVFQEFYMTQLIDLVKSNGLYAKLFFDVLFVVKTGCKTGNTGTGECNF